MAMKLLTDHVKLIKMYLYLIHILNLIQRD